MADKPTLMENLVFILAGFGFVFVVLLMLAGMTRVVGWIFGKNDFTGKPKTAAAPAVKQAALADVADAEEDELPPGLTAAIVAAAVHAVIGDQPHRILSIRPTAQGWAQEGRRAIFTSHSVR